MDYTPLPLFSQPPVSDPKRVAYARVTPVLPERRQAVYDALSALKRATAKEIGKYLRVPINEITPRVLELRKAGLVDKDGKKLDPESGVKVTVYVLSVKSDS